MTFDPLLVFGPRGEGSTSSSPTASDSFLLQTGGPAETQVHVRTPVLTGPPYLIRTLVLSKTTFPAGTLVPQPQTHGWSTPSHVLRTDGWSLWI